MLLLTIKMVGVFSKQRFENVTENEVEQLRLQSKNKNTLKSTNYWYNVFKEWQVARGRSENIQYTKPEDLNRRL